MRWCSEHKDRLGVEIRGVWRDAKIEGRENRGDGVISLLAVLVGALWLSGCCCSRPIPPPEDQVTDPVELLNRMSSRLDALQSARFRVVSEYYSDDVRGANFRQVVLVRQPDHLHIQILSPFDQTLSVLVANGQRLALYDMESQVYYHGSPTPENIARILPFYMTASDIVRVLLGGPPLEMFDPDPLAYRLEWDSDEGTYRLRVPLAQAEGHLDLWIRHGDWLVDGAERIDSQGDLVFELRTGGFEEVAGFVLPMRLRFLLQGENAVDMSLNVESVDLNVSLPDSLFTLAPPSGVEQVELD